MLKISFHKHFPQQTVDQGFGYFKLIAFILVLLFVNFQYVRCSRRRCLNLPVC